MRINFLPSELITTNAKQIKTKIIAFEITSEMILSQLIFSMNRIQMPGSFAIFEFFTALTAVAVRIKWFTKFPPSKIK